MSCNHGTQDNKVRKYHSIYVMVKSVHAAVEETQRILFCLVLIYSISKTNGRS